MKSHQQEKHMLKDQRKEILKRKTKFCKFKTYIMPNININRIFKEQ